MIDSHTHLNMQADPEGCIKRAREAGLQGILCIGTKMRSDTPEVDPLCAANPNYVWRTIGTHPGEAHEPEEIAVTVQDLVDQYRAGDHIIGIGETGLDGTYTHNTRQEQEASFRKQIDACLIVDAPIVLHTRAAEADTLAIVREYPKLRGIFHCYTGDVETALAVVEHTSFYVSMSGILTYPKSAELREVAKALPAERLLIETDAPYLAPVPHRGANNEPAYVLHTLEVLAKERGVSYAEMGRIAAENFRTLFNV